MSTEELVRDFLERGGQVTKVPAGDGFTLPKMPNRRGRWGASKALKPGGGKLS